MNHKTVLRRLKLKLKRRLNGKKFNSGCQSDVSLKKTFLLVHRLDVVNVSAR